MLRRSGLRQHLVNIEFASVFAVLLIWWTVGNVLQRQTSFGSASARCAAVVFWREAGLLCQSISGKGDPREANASHFRSRVRF